MDPQDILGVPEFLCPTESLRLRNTRNNAILDELPDLRGKVIDDGKLRIRRLLGCGTKAACYEAESTSFEGDLFAVKAIPRRKLNAPRRRRVEREIALHRRLSEGKHSENVLSLYRTCIDKETDIVFLITELCPEGDLQTSIARGTFRDSDSKIKATFLQIVEAVHEMHELGIYHCDLKPQNIFMRSCGAPVVGDFGLSSDKEISGKFAFGTIPYMSAELVQSINPTRQSHSARHGDIWALGVVLFNMVTGKFSWKTASVDDAQFRDYVRAPYDLLLRRFDITREANDIFRSCFTLDPSTRTTLKELRERVERISSFGSGTEKLPMKRENIHNLRLDLTDLPPPDLGILYCQQRDREDCPPSSSTVDSDPSPTCFRRPRKRNVGSKASEPLRVPRRKRKTLTLFEVAETPHSEPDERDISDMTSTSKSTPCSLGPRTPDTDRSRMLSLPVAVKKAMSVDITEEAAPILLLQSSYL